MAGQRMWAIKDANGNSITIPAPSKTKAKQSYKRMGMGAKVISVEDIGPAPDRIRLPYDKDGKKLEGFKPIDPITAKEKPGPNKPCHCGSGKKFKRCHGARGRRPRARRPDAKATVPLVQLPTVQGDGAGGEEAPQAAGAPVAASADKEGAPDGA